MSKAAEPLVAKFAEQTQVELPDALVEPVGQAEQVAPPDVVAPVGPYVLALHVVPVQLAWPVDDWYMPGAQTWQAVLPVLAA